MSTATEQDAAPAQQAEVRQLVHGEITVSVHDGTRVLRWSLNGPSSDGLTMAGIAAASRAVADYLDGLSDRDRQELAAVAGSPQIRISSHFWELPLLDGHGRALSALMTSVVNGDGAHGSLPS